MYESSKLAIWRIQTREQFGNMWLSDYIENRLGGVICNKQAKPECALIGEDENSLNIRDYMKMRVILLFISTVVNFHEDFIWNKLAQVYKVFGLSIDKSEYLSYYLIRQTLVL